MNGGLKEIALEVEREVARAQEADYYTVLGVARAATTQEIRQRFRELAKRYHADRYAQMGMPRAISDKMTALLGLISRAHATLSDSAKRSEYDATLDLHAAGIPSDLGTIVEAESLFRNGRNLLDRGLYEAALKKLDIAAELNPVEPEYAATAAFCKYWTLPRTSRGRIKDRALVSLIVDHISNYLEEHPHNDSACVFLAQIARDEGDMDRAIEYFHEALAINPKNLIAAREIRLHGMRKKRPSIFQSIFGRKK